jgi:hypothetical protein
VKRFAALLAVLLATMPAVQAQRGRPFDVREATIASIHAEMKAGRLTCLALVSESMPTTSAVRR